MRASLELEDDSIHKNAPRRVDTVPSGSGSDRIKIKKRVIVCCDGTWQDGIDMTNRWKYTNVLRLARTISHEDERFNPPIPQVVFYQSGIGSEDNLYSEVVEGATGVSLADKVEEAYAFIAHNYHPGDEIFLFGFSRGAYTARMVAMFIGEIGVLNRAEMDNFADIFIWYQKRGKSKDQNEIDALNQKLAPWTNLNSPGKKRAQSDQGRFSIKIVGVFDTVGSLGLPEELTLRSPGLRTIFGFPDKLLGEHIERAYHALAMNETRTDFDCAKFEQTEGGRRKKQILKQVNYVGSLIGGGWECHDLSDLTLIWMAANIGDALALDLAYLASLPEPVAPWGEQKFNDPVSGIFSMAKTIQRHLPTSTNNVTHETIHPSVLRQSAVNPAAHHPVLICGLLPLEDEMRRNWPFDPSTKRADMYAAKIQNENHQSQNILGITEGLSCTIVKKLTDEEATKTTEPPVPQNRLTEVSRMGAAFYREFGSQN